MDERANTLIICADRHDPTHIPAGSSQTQEFRQLLGEPVDVAQFDEIEFLLSPQEVKILWNNCELTSYKRIILFSGVKAWLRIAHPLARALRHLEVNAYTNDAERYPGVDKLTQYVELAILGLPFPKTYFASARMLAKGASKHLPFPLVVKDILASQGNNNFLVHDIKELADVRPKLTQDRYVAQEYIQSASDIRVLINASGDWFAFSRASQTGDYRHNTSKGAQAERVMELPKSLIQDCEKILHTMNLSLAGIDIIPTPRGEYVFLEVNTSPMIFTGAFVPEKMAWFKKSLPDR